MYFGMTPLSLFDALVLRLQAQRIKDINTEHEAFIAPLGTCFFLLMATQLPRNVCRALLTPFVSPDKFLKNKSDQEKLAGQELLHEWDEKVYRRINNQIAKQVDERKTGDINRRLNDQMDKYVEAVKTKVLFRDIIIESEYNPFLSKKAVIKVDARPRSKTVWDGIKDPLNEQIEKVCPLSVTDPVM